MKFLSFDPLIANRWEYLKFLTIENEVEVLSIVEIGTWDGENAQGLRSLFPEAHLYLIDPWLPTLSYFQKGDPPSTSPKEYEENYQKVCHLFHKDSKTTILRMTSLHGAKKVPADIDLVFIDGDHSYEHVKEDILTWKKKVRPGGLLAGHDYSPGFPEVMRAVDECLPQQFIVGKDRVWGTIT